MLWQEDKLILPEALWNAFRSVLSSRDKLSACEVGLNEKKIHGGASEEETLKHFVFRFPTSSSRLCYLLVDPYSRLKSVNEEIFASFTTGKIVVMDLAGGTGAATVGLLTTLAQLRAEQKIPSLPLSVQLLAADFSPSALHLYTEMIELLKVQLEMHQIRVGLSIHHWDASDSSSTSHLCDIGIAAAHDAELFVLVSNISGVGAETFKNFDRSFQHIADRISNIDSSFLWIEHPGKTGIKFIEKILPRIFPLVSLGKFRTLSETYNFVHAIQAQPNVLPSGLYVKQFKRNEAA